MANPPTAIPQAPDRITVFVRGKGKKGVTLTEKEYVVSGGEGHIWTKNGVAFKVCHKNRMIPLGKLDELRVLNAPFLVVPKDILEDKRGKPIGYTMPFVDHTHAMAELFPTAFWNDNGLTPPIVADVVREFQAGVQYVHGKGIKLVDINEWNFLVTEKDFSPIHFIDTNSYATPNFPAQAISPTVRDYHTQGFSEETDWYSWAVVTFFLWIGIHPFRGRHPDCGGDIVERMKKSASVLDPGVKIPGNCRGFDTIPEGLRRWYMDLFQQGKRGAPPTDYEAVKAVATVMRKVASTAQFSIEDIQEYPEAIVRFLSESRLPTVVTRSGIHVGPRVAHAFVPKSVIGVGNKGTPVLCSIKNETIRLTDLNTGNELTTSGLRGERLMSYYGRVFVKCGTMVNELSLREMGSTFVATARQVGSVMEKSTRMCDGVIVTNILGVCYALLPGESQGCYQVRLDEIEPGTKILDAKYDRGVLMVIVSKGGVYSKLIYRFNTAFTDRSLRVEEDVSADAPVFTVLEKGVCAHVPEDGKVELFAVDPKSGTINVIEDPVISLDMRLFNDGTSVVFSTGNKLMRLRMKS